MNKWVKFLYAFLPILLVFAIYTPECSANSAEPPSIVILVPYAPKDLEISIGKGDTYVIARKDEKSLESHYTVYSNDLYSDNEYKINSYTLKATSAEYAFEIAIPQPLEKYNNLFTLHLKDGIIEPGKSLSRSVTLVSLRILLTLLIEGIVFFLFGYRTGRSWLTFLIVNLITQGWLNFWLNGQMPNQAYIIIAMFFAELLILIAELIAYVLLLKEHKKPRAALYAIVANFVSLVVGGYIIVVLPI